MRCWLLPALVACGLCATADGRAQGLALGLYHSCAVDTRGAAYCWGNNTSGQLGDGFSSATFRSDVLGISDGVAALDAGFAHTCALIAGGRVKCWGRNDYGQLGDGTNATRAASADVAGLASGTQAVATGSDFSCAVTGAGGVKCWGANYGNLGNDTFNDSTLPVDVTGLASGASAISAGDRHVCALGATGVKCWGNNARGQLGDTTRTTRTTPVDVAGLSAVVAIAAGSAHTCAITTMGGVLCWGSNDHGELGDGSTTERATPASVSGLASGARNIATKGRATCVLTTAGGVKCWGRNEYGELGDGLFTSRALPGDVPGLTAGVRAIAAGFVHFCALMDAGNVKCWGDNEFATLGNGSTRNAGVPADVVGVGPAVAAMGLGARHTCVAFAVGGVRCWGDNFNAQLGSDPGRRYNIAGTVGTISSGATAIAAGSATTCALLGGGVKCWGSNEFGQLGNGTTIDRALPGDVPGLTSGVVAISSGAFLTCALTSGGAVKCWGLSNASDLAPVDIPGLVGGVVAIAAGRQHACALTAAGGLRCFGKNEFGQLGNGLTVSTDAPVNVAGLGSGVAAVAAGSNHSCALTTAGGVKCWGRNEYGQLGNASIADSTVPVDVSGFTSGVRAIAIGTDSTCALTVGGGVWCWGLIGTSRTRGLPASVPGLASGVGAIAVGLVHACALVDGGGINCFGENPFGQVGDGSRVLFRGNPETVVAPDARRFLDLTPEDSLQPGRLSAFVAVANGFGNNVAADIQFRSQDVGMTGSVFVFAVAPADIVRPAANGESAFEVGKTVTKRGTKETAVACVLSQLNASGQLQAVSASSLQAFITGVLTSQGAAVTVINGASAVNIGGATFYVGYGSNAGAMLNGGLNRSVVSVSGAKECKPQAPQTGWWWNKDEGGRGYSIEVQGRNIFYAAFLYDASGLSKWHVATGQTSLDGSLFTGDLLEVRSGQTLFGAYVPPNPITSVGPITLAFSDAATGTMAWPGGTVAIERFAIVPNGLTAPAQAGVPESGWWWNPAESGRGFFIEWQNGAADLAGYMYDEAGNPVWYLSLYPTPNPLAFTGNWWTYANGQTLTGAYRPATQTSSTFAPVSIEFHSRETATLTLPGGRTTSLTRHRF